MTTSTARILIIDDDRMLCQSVRRHIHYLQHEGDCAYTLDEGLRLLQRSPYDLVLLDVRLPDGNGLDALPVIQRHPFGPEVIVMTGEASTGGAEAAMDCGAWDYLPKPVSLHKLTGQLKEALQFRRESHIGITRKTIDRKDIAGDSAPMKACLESVAQAAQNDTNVLISGETGTGKELFCRAIHKNSHRSSANLVVVDCAALPETLIESTLFGHVKGAFTSADKPQAGLVEQADGGTLFLDEIGELSLTTQKVFLRVLQERSFRPVGGKTEKKSNFRLIAATNRDLAKMVQKGSFRKDLYYRINSQSIVLPPLRERPEDIPVIAVHHVKRLSRVYEVGEKKLSSDFLETLQAYSWPGNIRELVNILETAVTSTHGVTTLFSKHLPTHMRVQKTVRSLPVRRTGRPKDLHAAQPLPPLKTYRKTAAERAERDYLQDLLSAAGRNITSACHISGLSRSRLYEILKKHQMTDSPIS